jgi:hypothetical protein
MKMLGGLIAGTQVICFLYPLDLMRVRQMVLVEKGEWVGMAEQARVIVNEGGFMALYKGFAPSATVIGIYTMIKLGSFDYMKVKYECKPGTLKTALVGSAAGLMTITVTHPMDNVRRRLQLRGTQGYENAQITAKEVIQKIIKEQGYGGFWRGYRAAIGKMVPASMIQFSTYEKIN